MNHLVITLDGVSPSGLDPLRLDPSFTVVGFESPADPGFGSTLGEATGLIVRSATRVDAVFIEAATQLRVIGRAGSGVDNIDVAAASERGIAVVNAPGGNTIAAAELTMALILALARRVTEADRSVRLGRWERSRLRGVELRGRTVGVIGAGRIGSAVAERCRAFGMSVIACDPRLTETAAQSLRLELVSLDRLLATADVVTLHVPLNDETRGMIGAAALAAMKPTAFLVNVSRGEVVDEAALVEELASGGIAGAALDVFVVEPLPGDSPLLKAPNLILTPHLGASTEEAQIQVGREVAAKVRAVLAHGDFSVAVNAAEISGAAGIS